MKTKGYSALIVDDSEVDRFLLKRAIRDGAPQLKVIHELDNGEELIAYLAGEGQFADRRQHPLPELVFLDSRMPRKGGIEVLQWIRTLPQPPCKVVILADSSGTNLKSTALQLGAHYFFSKITSNDEMSRNLGRLVSDLNEASAAS